MRHLTLIVILAATVVGCAHAGQNPTVPAEERGLPSPHQEPGLSSPHLAASDVERDGPYRLWWEGTLYLDAAHERVDVVPRRDTHFHLNALKFLEDYCKDCLQITGIKNNGDGTIDLTVKITHPFKGFPQYTGFDVKGIIMFNGSYEYANDVDKYHMPQPFFRISWREMGDPELLNPDGYTPRWSPDYDSGSEMPVFNYWRGRFASGVPNADLNAYLNFYSNEERHMFSVDSEVSRTYTIYMPADKIVAGYAVEACWEEPLVMPVTNPLEDFPITANQNEAYRFKYIVNNGEVITDCSSCCGWSYKCSDLRVELGFYPELYENRNPPYPGKIRIYWPNWLKDESNLDPCGPEGWYEPTYFDSCHSGNGTQRIVAYNYDPGPLSGPVHISYEVFDYTVDDPSQ